MFGHWESDTIKRKPTIAILIALGMFLCAIPAGTDLVNQSTMPKSSLTLPGENTYQDVNTALKVDKTKKVNAASKIIYRYVYKWVKVNGKWKKVRYKITYRYSYKWVKVRGKWKKVRYKVILRYVSAASVSKVVSPNNYLNPTANCQSNDPRIKALASQMKIVTVNLSNPNPQPPEPLPVEEPTKVDNPGAEPTLDQFDNDETAYQQALAEYKKKYDDYQQYQQQLQSYNQYLEDLKAYQEYQPYTIFKRSATTYETAENINNWARDNVNYEFYYNTRKGAVGTMQTRGANCVDHAHLINALARAVGIPARYVHGTCNFIRSGVLGHVWSQLYVNGRWIDADATSSMNSFGVIKNWNRANFVLKGIYAQLPF